VAHGASFVAVVLARVVVVVKNGCWEIHIAMAFPARRLPSASAFVILPVLIAVATQPNM
jgi:hypothetical protein